MLLGTEMGTETDWEARRAEARAHKPLTREQARQLVAVQVEDEYGLPQQEADAGAVADSDVISEEEVDPTVKAWEIPLYRPLCIVKPVVTRWAYLYFCFAR